MNFLLGQITKNPATLAWLMLSAFVAGGLAAGGTAWTIQGWRLDAVKVEFKGFKDKVELLGKQAKKEAERINAENKVNKEKTDEAHKRTTATLQRELNRLRLTSGGNLSSPPASADSPDRTCFDPAKFATALRELDQGLLGIVETGSQAITDLDSAKKWAKGVAK